MEFCNTLSENRAKNECSNQHFINIVFYSELFHYLCSQI